MPKWDYKKIDYESIDAKGLKDNKFLFDIVSTASFIEITSNVYEKNLAEFYKEDEELTKWLRNTWEPEEIQHGKSLRKYIKTIWKDFDWDKAYENFKKEYVPLCKLEYLQESEAREMLARMVVETGTSTFYKALSKYAKDLNDPILEQLSINISKDEIYHFEIFEEAFKKYSKKENISKADIIKILYARLKEANSEDVKIAFNSINPDEKYEEFNKTVKKFAKKYYPYNMAIKMFIRPLALNRFVENATAASLQPAFKILGI